MDPQILAMATMLEKTSKQNSENPLAGIDLNSIGMLKSMMTKPKKEITEIEEDEDYMEDVIEYIDEIQSSNKTICENLILASFLDLQNSFNTTNDFDTTNKVAIINRVKTQDAELYDVFYNTSFYNEKFNNYMKVNYSKLKPHEEYKNIAIILALDTLPHTITSLKHNIVCMGENWAHTILCEQKNESFFNNLKKQLKLPNLNVLTLIPTDCTIEQLNGYLINKTFLDNFKNKQIFIYDNISTIAKNNKNKLTLKFELNM